MKRIGDQTSDGRYQWDGQQWVPTALGLRTANVPQSPNISPDGQQYWDGVGWRPRRSPDGRHYWDGSGWRPMPSQPYTAATSQGWPPWARNSAIAAAFIAAAILVGGLAIRNSGTYSATVSTWAPGSPDIGGSVTNGTHRDCYQVTVHIDQLDTQGIKQNTLSIPVGQLSAGQTKTWTNHLSSFGGAVDNPVDQGIRQMVVTSVECEQRTQ
jgi:hypothetical protein